MWTAALLQQTQTTANPYSTLFMFGGIAVIFYLLILRPQRRQHQAHQEMVQNLEKGAEVVTMGGIIGTIVHLKEDRVTLKSGDTRIEVDRAKIGRVIPSE